MMRTIILIAAILLSYAASAQTIGQLRYDTVKILKVGGNGELKVQNSTRDSIGGIFTNVGGGWGQWLKPRQVGDTLFIGLDSFIVVGGSGGGLSAVYGENGVTAPNDSTVVLGGTLNQNTTIDMAGFDLRLHSGGDFIIGNTSSSTAALQVIPNSGTNVAHFGEYLANSIPFIVHRKDTVTSANASSFSARLSQFDRRVRISDNNLTLSDKSGHFFGYQLEAKDSVRLDPVGSDLVYGTRTGINFTKFPGHSGRTIYQNGTFDFDATEGHLNMIAVTGSTSSSNYTRLRGYVASSVGYLITSSFDTVDNYLGYYATAFSSGKTKRAYGFFAGGVGNTDSLWGFYSRQTDAQNSFLGPTLVGSYGRPAGSEINNSSAILDVYSTTKGALFPRMTAAQRTAISSPAAGLVVYDTDSTYYLYYNGSAWLGMTGGGGGGSTNLGNTDLTQSAATRNYDIDDQNLYWLNTGTWRIYGAATHSGDRLLEIDGTNSLGYFGPDAGSVFWGFNADSLLIDGIGLRNDSTNNKILVYNPNTNTVSYSNWIGGGGGSVSFGTDNQVPYTNSAGTGFDYSANFTFDGSQLLMLAGSAASPTYSFSGDPNTGIYSSSGDVIGFATNGVRRIFFSNVGIGADNAQGAQLSAAASTGTAPGLIPNRTNSTTGIGSSSANVISLITSASSKADIGTSFIVNPGNQNFDFTVYGDTQNDVLFVDASTDRVGILTNTPGFQLDVNGMINTPGTEASTYRWAATATEVPATTTYAAPTNYIGSSTNYALFTPDAWLRVSVAGTLYGIPAYLISTP